MSLAPFLFLNLDAVPNATDRPIWSYHLGPDLPLVTVALDGSGKTYQVEIDGQVVVDEIDTPQEAAIFAAGVVIHNLSDRAHDECDGPEKLAAMKFLQALHDDLTTWRRARELDGSTIAKKLRQCQPPELRAGEDQHAWAIKQSGHVRQAWDLMSTAQAKIVQFADLVAKQELRIAKLEKDNARLKADAPDAICGKCAEPCCPTCSYCHGCKQHICATCEETHPCSTQVRDRIDEKGGGK